MKRPGGFTLIELLAVLAILSLLITIAVPRYIDHVERARETALRTDLKVMREAIDKFEGDQGRLPKDLDELVTRRYLKEIPIDPITDKRDSWTLVSAAEVATLSAASAVVANPVKQPSSDSADPVIPEGLADIRSGAEGKGKDGSAFRDW